jgi:hypothetical protein
MTDIFSAQGSHSVLYLSVVLAFFNADTTVFIQSLQLTWKSSVKELPTKHGIKSLNNKIFHPNFIPLNIVM